MHLHLLLTYSQVILFYFLPNNKNKTKQNKTKKKESINNIFIIIKVHYIQSRRKGGIRYQS
jgi:hypothetical protein